MTPETSSNLHPELVDDDLPRPLIKNHTVFQCIGGGAYGKVWLARDAIGEWRAVKAIYRRRFASNARAYRREYKGVRRYSPVSLRHESLLPILQVGRDKATGCFYYVMEAADHADGSRPQGNDGYKPRTLQQVMVGQRRLPAKDCVAIAADLAEAVDRMHKNRLVHRDIKPANIVFVHGRPKLADIGLVTRFDATLTEVGTLGYIAPDLFGKPEGDIYALGKVLYEMSTGLDRLNYPVLPSSRQTPEDDRRSLLELREVFNKACTQLPADRYRDVAEMLKDLLLLKAGESVIEQQRWRFRRALWKKWMPWAVTVSCMMALLTGLGFFHQRAAEQSRRRELREIRLSRTGLREAGWSEASWSRLQRAGAVHTDAEVLEQATAMLAGLDARTVSVHWAVSAVSAAFGPDGRAVASGAGTDHALLIDTNGIRTELPVRGEGPVCWPAEGGPLQFVAVSNRLVLREGNTGNVRREFSIPDPVQVLADRNPVLAIAADGNNVAAGLRTGVFVWNTATGELLGKIATEASSLVFSCDGSLLGVGKSDGATLVYATPGFAPITVLPPALRGNPILALAFARDPVVRYDRNRPTNGWLLATGDLGAGIVIWDLDRRQPRSFCRGSPWNVWSLAFHPDGSSLASAGRNEARIWDVATGQLLLVIGQASRGDSRALAFHATGRRLLFGGAPGGGSHATVGLWELESHRGIHVLRGLASSARKVWFSRNSDRVAALSDDWHLAVWDVASGRLLHIFETPVGVTADNAGGCFNAASDQFAFATWREACLYELTNGQVLQKWQLTNGYSDQLQFDPQGRLLLLRRERAAQQRRWVWRLFRLADATTPALLHEQQQTNWSAIEMAIPAGGERFLVWNGGSENMSQAIRAYDATSAELLWTSPIGRTNGDIRVCLDPSGRSFGYTADASGRLRLVELADFREIGSTPDKADQADAIGPVTGQFSGSKDNRWSYFDRGWARDGLPLVMDWQHLSYVSAFSPNGNLLAWGTVEGVVLVADIHELTRRLSSLR